MAIQVIDRAIRLMRVVARSGPITLTAISEEVGLPLPTTARILNSLVENGILHRLENRKYQLGARLLPMTARLGDAQDSLQLTHPLVEELACTTMEDCGFAILQGKEAVVVDWCYGNSGSPIIEPYSREMPLHCAFGMVLIAFQPAPWRERYIQTVKLRKLAAGSVTDKSTLASAVNEVRCKGLHVSVAANLDGAGSVSAPVFDAVGRLHGALFITAPLERMGKDAIRHQTKLLLSASKRLTATFQSAQRTANMR